MIPIIWTETIRSFGKNTTKDTLLVLMTLGFYIFQISYDKETTHVKDRSLKPRTSAGEWTSSILFAVVAATIVHTYVMQPYTIPTSSLEKTLLVGDFLFVSKFHYGARVPMTAVSFPMVHDSIPIAKTKSYFSKPQIPYFRLPGLQDIERNDIVVFSWPADTVRQFFKKEKGVIKPIDKKSNYVKRCVGIAGDTLSIINGYVHINGKKTVLPDRAKPLFNHLVTTKGRFDNAAINLLGQANFAGNVTKIPRTILRKERTEELIAKKTNLRLIKQDSSYVYYKGYIPEKNVANYLKATPVENMLLFNLTEKEALNYNGKSSIIAIQKYAVSENDTYVFPQSKQHAGNEDNFDPIYIPEAGKTIPIDSNNYLQYKRIIEVYEGRELGISNQLAVNGTQVTLNGNPIDSYTFKQDYYWMMGDNRHNSEDSRFWGFVPFNHVVGKPVFVFFSKDKNIKGLFNLDWVRWDRVFTTVGGSGKPVSYLWHFLAVLAVYLLFSFLRKEKKETEH